MQQIPLDLHRIEAPSLENFVAGRNAEVLAWLRALRAGAPPAGASVIYLWGEAGSGRTHLLEALVGARAVLGPGSPPAGFRLEEDTRIAAVDDCELLDAERQQRLFQLLEHVRARPGAVVVAAGAQPPLGLALRDDLRTRLGSGLVGRLHLLGDDEKAALLGQVAAERGVALSPEVVPWLLAHTSRDIRALLALFDALDRHAYARKRAITLPLLRELGVTGALLTLKS